MIILPLLLAAQAATVSVPLPPGCVPTLVGFSIVCDTAPPQPPVTPPPPTAGAYAACTAAGYTARPVTMAWPLSANGSVTAATFGPGDAVVVGFTTPSGGRATFQPAGFPPTQGTMRLATIGTSPCLFSAPGGGGIVSQTPAFNLAVGTCGGWGCAGQIYLAPNTTYYITLANRGGFAGTPAYMPTCSGNCPMRLDFNNGN